jgi:hypothetical protein
MLRDNRGGLWKKTVNYMGKFTIQGTEYLAKLWKLADGNALLVLSGIGQVNGEQILLYPSSKGPAILSGTLGTKDNKLGWVNVFKTDNVGGSDNAPDLNLTFKPATESKQNASAINTTDF